MTTTKKPAPKPAAKPASGIHGRMLEMTRIPDKVPVTPTVEYLVDQRVDERIGGLLAKLDEFIKLASHPLLTLQVKEPGMRVNFRSKERVAELLETGYLELDYLMNGTSVTNTIRRDWEDAE